MLIETLGGEEMAVAISWDSDPDTEHSATIEGREISWRGYAARVPLGGGDET